MTFVPPVLYAATPAARRAALIALHPTIPWGCRVPLAHDLITLAAHEAAVPPRPYLYWDIKDSCFFFSSWPLSTHTLVNSSAHMISYLRRHGQIPPT